MTDGEAMRAYEKRARLLCELRGHDPDERVRYSHPEGFAVAVSRPRWQGAALELRDADLIRYVLEDRT